MSAQVQKTGQEWTDAETQVLRGYNGSPESLERLAQTLGRSESAIRQRLSKLGLSQRKFRRWTAAEVQQLTEGCDGSPASIKDWATALGRTELAVRRKLTNPWVVDEAQTAEPAPPPTAEQRAELFAQPAYSGMYQNLLQHHGREAAEAYLAVIAANRGHRANPRGMA